MTRIGSKDLRVVVSPNSNLQGLGVPEPKTSSALDGNDGIGWPTSDLKSPTHHKTLGRGASEEEEPKRLGERHSRGAALMSGPTGAFFYFDRSPGHTAGASVPTVTYLELDRMLDNVVLAADTVVVMSGVRVNELHRAAHAARVIVVDPEEGAKLSDVLARFLGRKVTLVTNASFPTAFQDALRESLILNIETLDLTRSGAFRVIEAPFTDPKKLALERPVIVETYGELPKLLASYLQQMEHIKSLLVLLRNLNVEDGKHALRKALLTELKEALARSTERRQIVAGLPPMNLEDLKLNLAGLFALARRQAGQLTSAAEILTQVMSLRRLIDKKHEFALPIDDLPRDVQTQIDGNNLVLAILETEARWRLVEKVRDTIAGHVDGVNVLGSAAWGAYSEVKESSDVDLEVMLARADFKEFSEQLEAADFTRLNKAESLSLLRCGRGRVFAFLRALVDAGYLAGADAEEQARAALTKLGIFAELHQKTPFDNGWGHKPEEVGHEPVTPWFADYLAWKIDVDGVDVSLHVVPTETYCAAADVDLRGLDSTRVLTEIRVGQRKKVTAGKKETTHADFTSYPDKRSFDGKTVDFRCAVRAVLKEGDKLRLLRPSELSAQGYRDEDVYAWATQTPCVVIENGQLYHGLFQDKALWGELIDSHSDELAAARRKMLAHLVDRMAAEIEAGLVTSSNASILQLTSRFERVPAYAKRALLLEMKSQGQDAFLRLDELFERLGSDELRRYGLEPAPRNVD